jgi:hypothetical protein
MPLPAAIWARAYEDTSECCRYGPMAISKLCGLDSFRNQEYLSYLFQRNVHIYRGTVSSFFFDCLLMGVTVVASDLKYKLPPHSRHTHTDTTKYCI